MKENLQNKVCLITGATNGIGEEAAKQIALMGAEIVFIARNQTKANQLNETIKSLTGRESTPIIADLSSQSEVKKAAEEFLSLNKPLHILLNNAGIMNTSRRETVDGLEEVFSVNHLAYYTLTLLLMDKLIASGPGRIVNVASGAHMFIKEINFEDLQSEKEYKTMHVYGQSKLANILFTRELSNKVQSKGITVNCLHPGFVKTSFGKNNTGVIGLIIKFLMTLFAIKVEEGAETIIYLATSDNVKNISGEYFYQSKINKPSNFAENNKSADDLWDLSLKILKNNNLTL